MKTRDFTFTVTVRTDHVDKAFAVRDEASSALQDALDSGRLGEGVHFWVDGPYVACLRAPVPVVVAVATPLLSAAQFRAAYMDAKMTGGDTWTDDELESSWQAYMRDPAGHFLSKPQP